MKKSDIPSDIMYDFPKEFDIYKYVTDKNFKKLIDHIANRKNKDVDNVIAITGYEGVGKSICSIFCGLGVAQYNKSSFNLYDNITYIPTEKEVYNKFLDLPVGNVFCIDEAIKVFHKHKWHDPLQQMLNEMYATERNQLKTTLLCMPRFFDFSERMRNHRILLWIHVQYRGIAIVKIRSPDMDSPDPWYTSYNFKRKMKKLGRRHIADIDRDTWLAIETESPNYLCHFTFPDLPEPYNTAYKYLKTVIKKEYHEQEKKKINKINNFTGSATEMKFFTRFSKVLLHYNVKPVDLSRILHEKSENSEKIYKTIMKRALIYDEISEQNNENVKENEQDDDDESLI